MTRVRGGAGATSPPIEEARAPSHRRNRLRRLRESDAPLSEVAAQVGYGSEFSFANAFKREYGTAPGRYRHQAA
ncbi:helix-turn-helix domain-containing protein [Nonomuraea sp. NPDC049709]|uniref:helix-turn-helix domain-containing protein n=1 Tax=Nonomuraea sp. NPDC049709 TaxID=3154736 RepID=UPI003437F418